MRKTTNIIFFSCVYIFLPYAEAYAAKSPPWSLYLNAVFFLCVFLTVVFLVLLARKLRCTQAELAHSRNEQKYLLRIFDLAPLDVLWLDENLVITRVNKTAEQAAGKYHMDLVGMSHHDFDPDFPEEELLSLSTVDTNAKIHRRYPCVQEEPCRSCEEIIYSYGTGAGKVFIRYGFGLVDFVCNKTVERKCITLQSGQAHEVLRSAKRMRMEFIANMNHEIRTPMNAIIGYAEMLAASDLGGREQRFAETIYKSSMTLVSLLNDIMDLSKIESGRLKINQTVISLHHLVRESIVAFEDVARSKNLHLGVEIKKNVPDVILFDGVRLQQILQNLLSNAVKFTHHGSISIAVEASPSGVYQQPEAWTIDITVRDTGLGMDREQELIVSEVLNPVSEESFEVYSGIGFGVPLCAKLTSMMGGRIHLQTEPGKGAAFTVTFDNVLAPATAPQIEQEDKIVPQRRLSSTRIMVVDDMDLIKDVFVDYFNGTEFTVVSASNGDEALAQIKREQPGMIFLDLNLVGKDGNAVARELRANPDTEGIPIILMTGNLLEESEYKPLFDDFLQKPFRLEGLDRIVDKYKKMMERTGNDLVSEQAVIDTSAIKETASLATLWNNDLSYLLDQAMHTGSLSAALMLGNSIVEIGEKSNSETIVRLGEELADAAGEPNIVEVEQILTSLKAMSGYEI